MTLKQWIGAGLLALPFVVIIVASVVSVGWLETLLVFGGAAVIVGCIVGGINLVSGAW